MPHPPNFFSKFYAKIMNFCAKFFFVLRWIQSIRGEVAATPPAPLLESATHRHFVFNLIIGIFLSEPMF